MSQWFFSLPRERQQAAADGWAWLGQHASPYLTDNDLEITAWLAVNGMPRVEDWHVPKISDGGGNVALWCDGKRSYVIAAYSGHSDPKENGYALVSAETAPLKKLYESDKPKFDSILAAILTTMGFDPAEAFKQIFTQDFTNPKSN